MTVEGRGLSPHPHLSEPAPRSDSAFEICYYTRAHRPSHQVTIRNSVDGWGRDIHGVYRDGAWRFPLQRARYAEGFEMKFLLDHEWMVGKNLRVAARPRSFSEAELRFPPVLPRCLHDYDNLCVDETGVQQAFIGRTALESDLFDVIVIGSGMGGGVLAHALGAAGRRVLVLEAGGLLYPTHITQLSGNWSALAARHQIGHFVNEPGSRLLFGTQMCLGGRSIFWQGVMPRINPGDLAAWPETVRGYLVEHGYAAAERLMRKQRWHGPLHEQLVEALRARFPERRVEALPRSQHQPHLGADGRFVDALQLSSGKFSTADLLLDASGPGVGARHDGLCIALGHLVTRVKTDGRRATSVVCQDLLGGGVREYRGRSIVLAAGSIESAKIALASALRDPGGKMGRGLTDHPHFFTRPYPIGAGSPFHGGDKHAKLFLSDQRVRGGQPTSNIEVVLNGKHWDVRHSEDDPWRSPPGSDSYVDMKFIFSSPLDDSNFIRLRGPGEKVAVRVAPNQAGAASWPEVRDARNALLDVFGVALGDRDESVRYSSEGTVHHAGGSLRMSDGESGVVDADLRFHAYDNLFACDVSVFPMIPAANPSLTLVALALRLAERLCR